MKKLAVVLVSLVWVFALSTQIMAADGCTRIKDGVLTYSVGHYLDGQPLVVGYDIFGYNYQAHMFNGLYCNAYLGRDGYPPYEGNDAEYLAENPGAESHWTWPYRNIQVMMKWSDEWLSNQDCNGDGSLDRGYSCDPENAYDSGCPGAWLTNHMGGGGGADQWTYFTKIVAPADGSTLDQGVWYTASGTEIGPQIWNAFATIQEVESAAGATYVSPAAPGFGKHQ